MNYYLDTEFLEYKKQPKVLGLKVGKPIDTIELISIGIVAEDGREYYAICNEFDVEAAWDNEWLRENVLLPIIFELCCKDSPGTFDFGNYNNWIGHHERPEIGGHKKLYKIFRALLNKYGKSRKQISEEIKEFVRDYKLDDIGETIDFKSLTRYDSSYGDGTNNTWIEEYKDGTKKEFTGTSRSRGEIHFYAYYADYDWVVFCWLFGRMIDLPKGFPMYCRDLKQLADETWERTGKNTRYKKNENAHNALVDAKWNKELHEFIKGL